MNIDKRLSTYSSVSTGLSLLSNLQLMDRLDKARPLGASIGGITSLLEINDTFVFVKRIPLTDIEREPQNIRFANEF
jgi:hypothetical protein